MLKSLLQRFVGAKSENRLPKPESLLGAMRAVGLSDTPQNRDRLYRELLKGWLWFCVPEMPDGWRPDMTVVPVGMNISVATPPNASGEPVLPVFTDPAALANYDPNSPHLAFPAIEVFKMAVQLGVAEILVNPFDPVRKPIRPGGVLIRREFEALALAMIPRSTPDGKGQALTVERQTEVQISRCASGISAAAKSQLAAAAGRFPELEKIFRYRMRFVDTGSESEVFGLVCSAEGNRFHEIAGSLMSAIQPLVESGHYVDFTKLVAADMPLMQTHGEIVYEKAR